MAAAAAKKERARLSPTTPRHPTTAHTKFRPPAPSRVLPPSKGYGAMSRNLCPQIEQGTLHHRFLLHTADQSEHARLVAVGEGFQSNGGMYERRKGGDGAI